MQGPWLRQDEVLLVSKVEENTSVAEPLTGAFLLTSRLAVSISIPIDTASTVVADSITLQLQTAYDRDDTGAWVWENVNSVKVDLAGLPAIPAVCTLRSALGDPTQLFMFPLGVVGRIVATTGTGDTLTLDTSRSVSVQQPVR